MPKIDFGKTRKEAYDVFIGNFTKFCEVYNDTYGDKEVSVDGRGRIIL